ncbi:hypothetical protein MANES_06G014501v8 [Manihot esculenta]|uniref:Uncharacterized protein n=1 Tax=Manihot esculenta TaxID=3983 RepID=A0ACB7HG85_MANES|nr:hypothetical protein MANES_06G014501v8 [Manihot esculenta]
MWGTFWVCDAHLTSVFISFLIYLGALHFQKLPVELASISICAGPMDIPIINSSVNWWNTSHRPGSFLSYQFLRIESLFPNKPEREERREKQKKQQREKGENCRVDRIREREREREEERMID